MAYDPMKEKSNDASARNVSRRKFLTYAIGGATGAALLGWYGRATIMEPDKELSPTETLERLGKQSFLDSLNRDFTVNKGAFDTVNLQLITVEGFSIDNSIGTGEVFSLLFKGSASSPLEQGTYMLVNKSTGTFPLFLVPIHSEAGNIVYEAIINRLVA